MTKRVLVTGGSGYIGSKTVPLVAKLYPTIVLETMEFGNPIEGTENTIFIKGDIRDEDLFAQIIYEEKITDIIHLAAIVTDALVDMNPARGREVNNSAWAAMLHIASGFPDVKRVIYASSSSVYGSQKIICDEDTPPKPMTEYAASKLYGEEILFNWKDRFETVAIRCATACGPAPRMRLDTIVNIFCAQAYWKKEITVFGGKQWRSNIHVEDIATLYTGLLEMPPELIKGKVFNATAVNHVALELAEMVNDIIPAKITVTDDKDDRNYRMDADKLWRELAYGPQFTIYNAIKDNLDYFESGAITDPDDDLYFNTKRMAERMS